MAIVNDNLQIMVTFIINYRYIVAIYYQRRLYLEDLLLYNHEIEIMKLYIYTVRGQQYEMSITLSNEIKWASYDMSLKLNILPIESQDNIYEFPGYQFISWSIPARMTITYNWPDMQLATTISSQIIKSQRDSYSNNYFQTNILIYRYFA